jgi:hypothetical protein
MKTDRPTTEKLLAQFEGLHLLIEQTPNRIKLRLIEELNPLQIKILALLNIAPTIYNLSSSKQNTRTQADLSEMRVISFHFRYILQMVS